MRILCTNDDGYILDLTNYEILEEIRRWNLAL